MIRSHLIGNRSSAVRGGVVAGQSDDEVSGGYSSPPCFMHELDSFGAEGSDLQQERDVRVWRKSARERLIAARMGLLAQTRAGFDTAIMAALEAAIGPFDDLVVSAYWPFRAEPDLRAFLKQVTAGGGRCALPVVVGRGQPLVFRAWAPGEPLGRGVWNIPIPLEEAPVVSPDVVIAPLVGFDPAGYRLGYGGGFFDRTLAAMARALSVQVDEPERSESAAKQSARALSVQADQPERSESAAKQSARAGDRSQLIGRCSSPPRVFGVGYDQALLPTIYPQWHDIPMDIIVTESGPKPVENSAA